MENYWEGKLVRLRAVELQDSEFFISCNLDSERGRFLDFLWPPQSPEAVRAWVASQASKKLENDSFTWMIESKDSQTVGSIATHDCNPHNGTFSFGLDIAAAYRRKGYASEAISLVLGYYFNELRYQKVTVPVHGDNPASVALHERLGFQLEGRLRRMIFTRGAYIDLLWYGMTVDEFRLRPGFGI